jgi:hypothetical protein
LIVAAHERNPAEQAPQLVRPGGGQPMTRKIAANRINIPVDPTGCKGFAACFSV